MAASPDSPNNEKSVRTRYRRRNKHESIRKLLQAGREVFSKRGFEAATTKQIAKRAGMNEALIARYFKSKAGLLQAIIVTSMQESKLKASTYPPGANVEEEIVLYLSSRIRECGEKRDFYRIAISRMLVDKQLSREVEKHIQVTADDALTQKLQKFRDAGEIAGDYDLSKIVAILQLQTKGILLMKAIHDQTDNDFIDSVIRQFAKAIAAGLKA